MVLMRAPAHKVAVPIMLSLMVAVLGKKRVQTILETFQCPRVLVKKRVIKTKEILDTKVAMGL